MRNKLSATREQILRPDMPTSPEPIMTGRDLKEWRERMKFTQDEAAKAIGCARRSIQVWEKEPDKEVPKWLAMAVGAVAYGLPPYR
jgi:DNA-binding XRE family transcriptional regulator